MSNVCDLEFKVVLIGNSSVGKSSIIQRMERNTFDSHQISTIGMDLVSKVVQSGSHFVKMQLWDTAGQERFKTAVRLHSRGARGVFLTYSVDDPDSFKSIREYYDSLIEDSPQLPQCILVANKCDLVSQRMVTVKEGKALAVELGNIPYMECSAKNSIGVLEILQTMTDKLVELVESTQIDYQPKRTKSSRPGFKLDTNKNSTTNAASSSSECSC